MINYVTDPTEAEWKGYFYAFLMFFAALLQSILTTQHFIRSYKVAMQVRSAVIAAVYRKVRFRPPSIIPSQDPLSLIRPP